MAYDSADWHYGGDFPAHLPQQAGATHIGMFLACAIVRGLEGTEHRRQAAAGLGAVRARQMTGREFLLQNCGESLTTGDLGVEGNALAEAYYRKRARASYLVDYADVFDGFGASIYHVADTWENFDLIAAMLDRRYAQWKANQVPQ